MTMASATLSFSIENILRRSPRCRRRRDVMQTELMTSGDDVVAGRCPETLPSTPMSAHLAAVEQVRKRLHMDTECSQDAEERQDGAPAERDGEEEIDVMGDAASSVSVTTTTDVSSTSSSSAGDETDESPEVKRKKARTAFSSFQINELEGRYHVQRYLAANERKLLSQQLGLKDHQVKTWFQNRRMKEKRQMRETDPLSSLSSGYSYDHPLSIGIPPLTSHPAFRDALVRGHVAQLNLHYPANQDGHSSNPYVSANQHISAAAWAANQGAGFVPPAALLRPEQYARQSTPSGGYYLEPTIDVSTEASGQTAHPGVWSSYNSSLSVA